jgi:hypothetical protein
MAIPRTISLLEESRNRGMAINHSSGIEEDKIYSSGSSRNFEELESRNGIINIKYICMYMSGMAGGLKIYGF